MPRYVGAGKIRVLTFSASQLFTLTLRGWGIYSGWSITVSVGCMGFIVSIFLGSSYGCFS